MKIRNNQLFPVSSTLQGEQFWFPAMGESEEFDDELLPDFRRDMHVDALIQVGMFVLVPTEDEEDEDDSDLELDEDGDVPLDLIEGK